MIARGACSINDSAQAVGGVTTIGYSDLTLVTPNAKVGATATAHIIDSTTSGNFCNSTEPGPYSVGLEFYSSFASYANDDDPVVMLPLGWSHDGPGLGEFSPADFGAGVDVDFVVPSDLPVGDYQVYAFCIGADGYSAGGSSMGLQPFSVTAGTPSALAATGVNPAEVGGFAALAAALLAAGVAAAATATRRRVTRQR